MLVVTDVDELGGIEVLGGIVLDPVVDSEELDDIPVVTTIAIGVVLELDPVVVDSTVVVTGGSEVVGMN